MLFQEQIKTVKQAAPELAATTNEQRNAALAAVRTALQQHQEEIFEANRQDMEQVEADGVSGPVRKRLKFDEGKLRDVMAGISDLTGMEDPLFQTQFARELDEGLRTNRTLFDIIHRAVINAGLPADCMMQLEARSEINELLECHDSVDLLIPRGSNAFVQYIMNHTKIPVMGHADGICHIYVDKEADLAKAVPIIVDAKTQYVSACNTVETILIHEDVREQLLPMLKAALDAKQVELRGTKDIAAVVDCVPATEMDDRTEYLDYILSAKTVKSVEEAIVHINRFGSHHTDCIITENPQTAEHFMNLVDSAGVYQNCSTRFADGYRYGFGAEVGISTGKLHARGPVGLEGLVSYKYKLYGSGQIVADYASGEKQFHFKNLYKRCIKNA